MDEAFEQCRSTLRKKAVSKGFSALITNDIINTLEPLERVIKLDRSQPEFTESFIGYATKRMSEYRIKTGKRMLAEHAVLLDKLARQYGVPARYIVAFWGLETNYGGYKGKIKTLNALATLACDPRRSQYFTQELFNIFTLLDDGRIQPDQLLGSWAGAMGHMQFMPTTLITYGVDGDGDGKLNVWGSLPDALTSAANYLNKIGWNKEEIWGRTVELPKNFDFAQVVVGDKYPLSHFKKLGITKTYKRPLSNYDTQAKLILPSGHLGPAFLVYANFSIILKWNYSQNYALVVGLLADQLAGINHGLDHYNAKPHPFTNKHLKALQQKLLEQDYKIGKPDGIWGPKTRKAMQQYQLKNNLVADGFPNAEVFEALAISLQ
ncbi:lytic murein transglycosylase [Marinagarivorans algicola]|uniref:lytic murein transglycosylase n=1 Tax=Marinagarivorans algicola TaxID=1513270 RepID=UPI00373578E7